MAELLDVVTLPDGRTGTIVDESADFQLVEICGEDGVPIEFVTVKRD